MDYALLVEIKSAAFHIVLWDIVNGSGNESFCGDGRIDATCGSDTFKKW